LVATDETQIGIAGPIFFFIRVSSVFNPWLNSYCARFFHESSYQQRDSDLDGASRMQAGLKTTIRYSLGADIGAACGQLVKKENREQYRRANREGFPSRPRSID